MPRDGSGVYNVPSGTYGVPDTTIGSTQYNDFVNDVAQDLNHPRPIVAGGTGATNAADALAAMHGEEAGQVVTNFDSDPLVAGSFHSLATATNPPVAGHIFTGIVYQIDASNMVIEARDESDTTAPGRPYVREMKAGVWSAWTTDVDATRLAVAGGQTTTGGFAFTAYYLPPGDFTVYPMGGNYQYISNIGAFTITAPTIDCAVDILVTNGPGAGNITFAGFTVGPNTGDLLTTASGSYFILSIRCIRGIATYVIKALQ
jgi:hypothetical protein